MDTNDFEDHHIIHVQLSPNKSESIIKQYARMYPENKGKAVLESSLRPKKSAPSTLTSSDQPNDLQGITCKINLPNFNLQPTDEFDTTDDIELAN